MGQRATGDGKPSSTASFRKIATCGRRPILSSSLPQGPDTASPSEIRSQRKSPILISRTAKPLPTPPPVSPSRAQYHPILISHTATPHPYAPPVSPSRALSPNSVLRARLMSYIHQPPKCRHNSSETKGAIILRCPEMTFAHDITVFILDKSQSIPNPKMVRWYTLARPPTDVPRVVPQRTNSRPIPATWCGAA